MKHLSKAIAAVTFLAAATAAHAQTSFYGTDFSGSTTYPYTDGSTYLSADESAAAGPSLIGQNGWTGSGTNPAQTFQVFNDGAGKTFVQIASQEGGGAANHALTATATAGYFFGSDFAIYTPGALSTGNTYSFNFTLAGTNVFSVSFLPSATPGAAPTIELTENVAVLGTIQIPGSTTSTQGPPLSGANNVDIAQFVHLTVGVTNTGAITASLGTPGSTVTGLLPAAAAINGVGFSEIDNTGAGNDLVLVNDISVVVPEPSTYAMIGLGLLGTFGMMKFRRRKA